MQSKTCVCGQHLWFGDRYCIGCGRRISWEPPKPTKEAGKILQTPKRKIK
jgi:hypothetical protein